MRECHRIILASNSLDKFDEFKALLNAHPQTELILARDILRNADKLALVETHDTYLANAIAKARTIHHGSHYPTLGDDTGLEVDALNGKPGVHTQRYARIPGRTLSRQEQDRANIELLLSELQKSGNPNRKARFVTVLALLIEGILIHAVGTLEGTIADRPAGTQGFGYDSIFVPQGSQKTLAEMSPNEKNSLSHRAQALQKLFSEMQLRNIVLSRP